MNGAEPSALIFTRSRGDPAAIPAFPTHGPRHAMGRRLRPLEAPGPTDRRAADDAEGSAPRSLDQAPQSPARIRDRQAQVVYPQRKPVSLPGDRDDGRGSLSGQRAPALADAVHRHQDKGRQQEASQAQPGRAGKTGAAASLRGRLRESPGIPSSSRRGQSVRRGGQMPRISRSEGACRAGVPAGDETGQLCRRRMSAVVPQADMVRKIARYRRTRFRQVPGNRPRMTAPPSVSHGHHIPPGSVREGPGRFWKQPRHSPGQRRMEIGRFPRLPLTLPAGTLSKLGEGDGGDADRGGERDVELRSQRLVPGSPGDQRTLPQVAAAGSKRRSAPTDRHAPPRKGRSSRNTCPPRRGRMARKRPAPSRLNSAVSGRRKGPACNTARRVPRPRRSRRTSPPPAPGRNSPAQCTRSNSNRPTNRGERATPLRWASSLACPGRE